MVEMDAAAVDDGDNQQPISLSILTIRLDVGEFIPDAEPCSQH